MPATAIRHRQTSGLFEGSQQVIVEMIVQGAGQADASGVIDHCGIKRSQCDSAGIRVSLFAIPNADRVHKLVTNVHEISLQSADRRSCGP